MNVPRKVTWAVAIPLSLLFILVGVSKLLGTSAVRWTERFLRWDFPAWSVSVIGLVEILAGIALLVPRLRRPAAAMLTAIMGGALLTHFLHAEFARTLPPLVLGGLALFLATTDGSRN